jgi:hypothetical protein
MNQGLGYIHCFLHCPHVHAIPLPTPSLLERDGSPRSSAKENRTAVFVCPECGLGSSYSSQDIHEQVIADRPSLFQRGECLLVSVEIECDGENCEAPKVIHTIQGVDTGTWRPTAAPKDWHFSETALCVRGHRFRYDLTEVHQVTHAEMPF